MTTQMIGTRPRLGGFRLLVALAVLAVASLFGLPIEQLLPPQPLAVPLLRLATMVQPLLLIALALWVGHRCAPRLGLGLPLLDAGAAGRPVWAALRPHLVPVFAVMLATGALLVAWSRMMVPALGLDQSALAQFQIPLLTRIFYGGIGEEVMLRWGLLSALAVAGLKLGLGRTPALVLAALISAMVFGAGHLPLLNLVAAHPPAWAAGAVVLGNALPGMLFAALFIRCGLEAAMLAHAGAHLIGWLLA